MFDETLKPYLAYSAAGHLVLALGAAILVARAGLHRPQQVYRIDFIGSTGSIINRSKESGPQPTSPRAAPPLAKPTPEKDQDAFTLKKHKYRPLPKPSLLESSDTRPKPEKPEASPATSADTSAKPTAASSSGGGEGQGSASVSPDMPNFPYPWYISQLRAALWDRWSARMPSSASECVVSFSVLRDGKITDLRVESTSGDAGFDYAAMSAVRDAAPFGPLPGGFTDPFLKIHVQFKSNT